MKRLISKVLALFMSRKSIDILKEFLHSIRNDYRSARETEQSEKAIRHPPPYKLNIGCGSNIKDRWINIDLVPPADMRIDVRNGLPFPDNSCEVIYSEHFLEHLSYPSESIPFLEECRRVLKPGGVMHIGVPDSRYVVESCLRDPIDREFLSKVKLHNWGYPEYCKTGFEFINYHFRLEGHHKFAFDLTTLKSQLERVGFSNVRKRSYEPGLDTMSRAEGTLYVVAEKKSS